MPLFNIFLSIEPVAVIKRVNEEQLPRDCGGAYRLEKDESWTVFFCMCNQYFSITTSIPQ